MTQSSGKYESPVAAIWKGVTDLFKPQERIGALTDEDRLDGQNVLITGASSGLGFATAVQLAQRGASLWLACRSGIPKKGEEIMRLSGSDKVKMLHVDLADMVSIDKLVAELKASGVRFDRVICNAAIVPGKSRKTPQGLEEMFMVNYLAKFILINALLKANLLAPPPSIPRIVFVSSESHRNPKAFKWEQFGKYQEYGMDKSVSLYGYYKLLLTTFANELSRRLNPGDQTMVSVFALCPGPVNTNIAREAPKIFHPLLKVVFGIFFKAPEKAAEPVVYLSCSPDEEGKALDYLFLMGRKEMDALATDPENGRRLWELSEELVNK